MRAMSAMATVEGDALKIARRIVALVGPKSLHLLPRQPSTRLQWHTCYSGRRGSFFSSESVQIVVDSSCRKRQAASGKWQWQQHAIIIRHGGHSMHDVPSGAKFAAISATSSSRHIPPFLIAIRYSIFRLSLKV